MRYFVIVSDINPDAPAARFADDFIRASAYDPKETLNEVRQYQKKRKINGVIAVGIDAPHTVAAVATALNLPSHSIKTSKLATNKLLMKKAFVREKVATPWFSEVGNLMQLKKILAQKKHRRLVIKPQDSRGGRGVLQLDKVSSLEWAYDTARAYSPTGGVIIEEFIEGPQISTESFIAGGKIYTPGFIDREYPYLDKFAPYFIEAGGQQPTKLSKKIVEQVDQTLLKAAKAIGIREGIIKGDIVIDRGVVKIIELAARLSGGYMATVQIPLATGVDFVGIAIKYSLGEKLKLEQWFRSKYQKGIAIRYWFPKPGRIVQIMGEEKLKKMAGVKFYQFFLKVGDACDKPSDLTKRFGFVICEGETRAEAVRRAKQALKAVKIVTE